MIDRLAKSQAPVFINGESGSGKELAARMIHLGGPRAELPFIAVNCGAIPENLMESEFFGYKKGAFTGAEADRDGFFQAANGGTLFLDEVADLPLPMQVKLLRAIQEKKVRKVGSTAEEPVDVRLISATHKKLATLVENGEFRQDLYYRLHVIELVDAVAARDARGHPGDRQRDPQSTRPRPAGLARARCRLRAQCAIRSPATCASSRTSSSAACRSPPIRSTSPPADLHLTPPLEESDVSVPPGEKWPLQDYLDRVERAAINEALEKTRFNRTAAAKLLGITFRAMRYRMERLGIK